MTTQEVRAYDISMGMARTMSGMVGLNYDAIIIRVSLPRQGALLRWFQIWHFIHATKRLERSFNIRPIDDTNGYNYKDAERVRGLDSTDHTTVGMQYVRFALSHYLFSSSSSQILIQVLTTSTQLQSFHRYGTSVSHGKNLPSRILNCRVSSLLHLWDSRSDPWLKPLVTWGSCTWTSHGGHTSCFLRPQQQQFQLRNPRILSCRIWNHFTVSYPNAKACFSQGYVSWFPSL